MYPNPQDVLPLPPRPDADHYRTRARELVRAFAEGQEAVQVWATRWVEDLTRLHGDPRPSDRDRGRTARQVAEFARERLGRAGATLAQAQFVIARAHGFAGWPRLLEHLGALHEEEEPSRFERAADLIVAGELAALESLLAEQPSLIHARSTREHRAALLHYVSANGVENYRQRSPANIVAIARALLEAGADVDAEANVYGGGATTLGLVVTSTPPRQAGVQLALADLLLERGARLPRGIVRDCLMNGCPEAAAHLAPRAGPLTLEEAAGIGDLEAIRRRFADGGPVPAGEGANALGMAAWYDRREATALLLDGGVPVDARTLNDGSTALHVAAYQGHAELVGLLLERGAPLEVTDNTYGTTPLTWALHAWQVEDKGPADAYREVVRRLRGEG